MGIPILSDVLRVVDSAIDKLFPNADNKAQLKSLAQSEIIKQAMQSESLLFQDTEGARELFKIELENQKAPPWTKAIQVLARPFVMYSVCGMYVWNKIAPLLGWPAVALTTWDYYLIGTIFVFLFGARSFEKILGKS